MLLSLVQAILSLTCTGNEGFIGSPPLGSGHLLHVYFDAELSKPQLVHFDLAKSLQGLA